MLEKSTEPIDWCFRKGTRLPQGREPAAESLISENLERPGIGFLTQLAEYLFLISSCVG